MWSDDGCLESKRPKMPLRTRGDKTQASNAPLACLFGRDLDVLLRMPYRDTESRGNSGDD